MKLSQSVYLDNETFTKKHLLIYIVLLNICNTIGEKLESDAWKEILKCFDKCVKA
jgi:hypothetical protein